jgi:hypothetical protein
MSGRVSSSGRSGPNRRSTKKFARLFYLARLEHLRATELANHQGKKECHRDRGSLCQLVHDLPSESVLPSNEDLAHLW